MLALTQPAGIARARKRPCRYLTVGGLPCRQTALVGQNFCHQHGKHRHPVCPSGPNVVIPLIEDAEAVQLIATQVAQGLFAETLDPVRAGRILYACRVAASTFPRPARLQPLKAEPVEPVTEVFEAPDGELLGPAEIAPAARAHFDSAWSFDKYRYEEECERLGRPAPETPADMPASGWLSPADLDNINQQASQGNIMVTDGYRDKMLELRLDADRRGALPPLAERQCSYGDESWCCGPAAHGEWQSNCARCVRERDEYCALHPGEPRPVCRTDAKDFQAVAEFPASPVITAMTRTPGAPPLSEGQRRFRVPHPCPKDRVGSENSPAPAAPQPLLSKPSTPRSPLPATPNVVSRPADHPTRDNLNQLVVHFGDRGKTRNFRGFSCRTRTR
jgi:hypothetical protein